MYPSLVLPFSPVQRARKFSTVLGTVSPKRPTTILPARMLSMSMSKNTLFVTFSNCAVSFAVDVYGLLGALVAIGGCAAFIVDDDDDDDDRPALNELGALVAIGGCAAFVVDDDDDDDDDDRPALNELGALVAIGVGALFEIVPPGNELTGKVPPPRNNPSLTPDGLQSLDFFSSLEP